MSVMPPTPPTNSPSTPRDQETLNPRTELSLNEQVGHNVDMWKKTIDVQQHFNDIEWRIRGLALTVATFALGAAGIAAKDGTKVGWLSLGSLVLLVGLLLWYAFYFVDRVWYHPLLKSASDYGSRMEKELRKTLPEAGLTDAISAGSPQDNGWLTATLSRKKRMRSVDKLVWFYQVGGAAFVFAAIALQIGALLTSGSATPP